MKKFFAVFLAAVMVFAFSATALAGTTKNADITYRGINIVIDGQQLIPRDVNGKDTEPFIIDGTTYLPVRAIANGLGLSVDWDAANSTVILNDGGRIDYGYGKAAATKAKKHVQLAYRDIKLNINGIEVTPEDANGKVVEPFIIDGTTYLPIRAVGNALGAVVNWDPKTNTVDLMMYLISEYRSDSYGDGFGYTNTYDEHGNLIKMVDNDGSVSIFTYDSNNRELTMEYSYDDADYSMHRKFVNTYDNSGNLIKCAEDRTERVGSETSNYVLTTICTYDANGNCLSEKTTKSNDPDNFNEYAYTYDSEGNCIKQSSKCTFDFYEVNSYGTDDCIRTFDANGNCTYEKNVSKTFENGALTAVDVYELTYTYDSMGNIIKAISESRDEDGSGNVLADNSFTTVYSYDLRGNRITERTTYKYDIDGQEYIDTYESLYTYNEYFAVIREDTTDISNGVVTATGCRSYVYDDRGRLVEESWRNDADGYGETTTYVYGANGRDYTAKTVDSDGGLVTETLKYVLIGK